MKTPFLKGFFTEYLNGVYKPSMNRLLAFLIISGCLFMGCWCVIQKQSIPDATLIEFLSFVAVLLGLSWNAKTTDLKSTSPNPNLPPPTPQG